MTSEIHKENKKYHFKILKDGDEFIAQCVELPELICRGKTKEELGGKTQEALDEWTTQIRIYTKNCPEPYVHFLSTGLKSEKHHYVAKSVQGQVGNSDFHSSTQSAVNMYHYVCTQGGKLDLTGKKVLEVSCGKGAGALILKYELNAHSYVGVDITPDFIKIAKGHFSDKPGISFFVGDACDLASSYDNSFDYVVNLDASHGYPSLSNFLSCAYQALLPKGVLLWGDVVPPNIKEDNEHTMANRKRALVKVGFSVMFEEQLSDALQRSACLRNWRDFTYFVAQKRKD